MGRLKLNRKKIARMLNDPDAEIGHRQLYDLTTAYLGPKGGPDKKERQELKEKRKKEHQLRLQKAAAARGNR